MNPQSLRPDVARIVLPLLALITTAVAGCSGSSPATLEVRFDVADGGAAATLQALQFYVHDVELLDEEGTPHSFALRATAPWQSQQLALVDLAGDAQRRHAAIVGTVESGPARYSGIRFTVGVPFELNHGNPLQDAAPLDRSDLFWAWQSGHKFLRADAAVDGHEWSFHLGSTGCSSASAVRPPALPCAQPNRVRVELKGDPLASVVRFNLDVLAAAARAANHVTCTGLYGQDPACAPAYASSGLQVESGTCPGGVCSQQTLWTLN
jgi:uncharacterized repeat protein (TIGR04052 family)